LTSPFLVPMEYRRLEVHLKDHNIIPPSRRGSASALPPAISQPGLTALILRLRRNSPEAVDAVQQLYELTSRIVRPYVGPNANAPGWEDQVEDLISVTLEVIFSGGLTEPLALPQFIDTLARHWNRAAIEPPRFRVSLETKRRKRMPFSTSRAK
jgi:hypothetical protein